MEGVKSTKAYIYAKQIQSGEQIACKYMQQAADRFLRDIKREDLYFDLNEVEMVTGFFENILYVPELKAPVPLPLPHAFWIQQLYGFRYKETKLRRFTEMILLVARKNYKTFYAAGISDYELILGNDNDPMIMQGANSRDQALICTDMAGKLIKASPDLNAMYRPKNPEDKTIEIFTYRKKTTEIVYEFEGRHGRIEAMPRDVGDGGNPSLSVIDELHEATDLSLLETMKSGQGARLEPMNLIISSPGHNKQGPLYSVLRDQAIKMLNGIIEDDRKLAIIFEQDNEEDWDKPEFAEKANPMIPYSRTLFSFWKERIQEAKNKGGATEVNVKIKNCGVWVDAAEVWIPDAIIIQNDHGITDDDLIGRDCYLGIDLSKAKDLTVVVYFFPNVKDGIDALKVVCFIPEDKLTNNDDHVDYHKWYQDGWVQVHDGNVIDHDLVGSDTLNRMEKYNMKGIGFDAKFAYQGVITTLAKNGYEELCTSIGQGFTLSTAVTEVEMMLLQKKVDLMKNPVTRWNFANVVMKEGDQGHRYPSKGKSANKIDIVSAYLTARTEYNHRNSEPEIESGVLWL
jgi:phage terminase large subunit-like protein